MAGRVLASAVWGYAAWLLLTWTATAEQLLVGAGIALALALTTAPLGDVVRPWALLDPRRLGPALALVAVSLVRIVRANLSLARRIWSPSRPLASGMVVIPAGVRSDGALGTLGLVTSLIVDNQIVDLDRDRGELQYHAVAVPAGTPAERAEAILEPMQRLVAGVDRGRR